MMETVIMYKPVHWFAQQIKSWNIQENTCVGVFFMSEAYTTLFNRDSNSNAVVFSRTLWNFWEHLF